MEPKQPHILIVTYPRQGHIKPALHLARRLATAAGARVTFSTSVSAHRLMFPSNPDQEVDDGVLSYAPFSDGYDDGFREETDGAVADFFTTYALVGSKNFAALVGDLQARGRRIDCIVYTFLLPWAARVAQTNGIPAVHYWIQPATVFAIYYHYFHGDESLVSAHSKEPSFTVNLPALPPLRVKDLPSFLTTSPASADDPNSAALAILRETFKMVESDRPWPKPRVLINTFSELEANVLDSVAQLDLIPVGPVSPLVDRSEEETSSFDLFKPDEKRYMEWLDTKPERSVVYVSFGSMSVLEETQMEEVSKGLKESGRPFLWVVREGGSNSLGEGLLDDGMIVEWCSQARVLSHPSVGCFVTHCGWNSTVECLASGVPMVGVPQWSDQGTNATLVERVWGVGARVDVNGEGLVEGGELRRCLEVVMGDGERGVEIRKKAEMWRDKARVAAGEGGSSDRNLHCFVEEITKLDSTEQNIDPYV